MEGPESGDRLVLCGIIKFLVDAFDAIPEILGEVERVEVFMYFVLGAVGDLANVQVKFDQGKIVNHPGDLSKGCTRAVGLET